MTMPVRSVRVRAGIVNLPYIVAKTAVAWTRRAYINGCVSNQLSGTIVTSD
jgi:hypothetical protein